MVSCESCFIINHGSSLLNKLVLIIILVEIRSIVSKGDDVNCELPYVVFKCKQAGAALNSLA